jgi:hypothetical protein
MVSLAPESIKVGIFVSLDAPEFLLMKAIVEASLGISLSNTPEFPGLVCDEAESTKCSLA